MTSISDVRADAFLGGRLTLWQPVRGYRAGIDPVLLAAAVPARAGERVLDLGCGAGAAMLCLGTRVPDLVLVGVELQAGYAELARRNAAANGLSADIHVADLREPPAEVRRAAFDHVIANPPYFRMGAGTAAGDGGRAASLGGDTPLVDWTRAASARLRPRGLCSVIQRADRLPDLLDAMVAARLGSLVMRPLHPRRGRDAALVIVQGVKDGRAPFRLGAPVILHDNARHMADGDDYTAQVRRVLRDAAPLAEGDD